MELLRLSSEDEYWQHYTDNFCKRKVQDAEGYSIKFNQQQFKHAFFTGSKKKKSEFSKQRAERMDWIQEILLDENVETFVGWNQTKKCYNFQRRVSITKQNYIVVIEVISPKKAKFITAFQASSTTAYNIRKSPKWHKKGS